MVQSVLMDKSTFLMKIYCRMSVRYEQQRWWPGDSPFEVMVGAVLTQSTAWANVEKAIGNLRDACILFPAALREINQDELACLVYPSGYYNAKARKLKALAEYLGRRYADDIEAMISTDPASIREELLAVYGIGQETADDILLYALSKPFFVIDAYTRRLFSRLGIGSAAHSYSEFQWMFSSGLRSDPELFGEYHALIVRHGSTICRKKPQCEKCCLLDLCPTGTKFLRDKRTKVVKVMC